MVRIIRCALAVAILGLWPPCAADDSAQREAVRIEIEHLRENGLLSIGDVEIASGDLLAEVYERRGFSPAWSGLPRIESLLDAIRATPAEGLDPADYHLADVEFVYNELAAGRATTPQERAALDIMLTDSLIRLGYHLRYGKVNPRNLDSNWNFRRDLNGRDPAAVVQQAIDSESPGSFISTLMPRGPRYRRLQQALADYRKYAKAGGWPQLPEGPTLKPGATDSRLGTLARRLAVTGDLTAAKADGEFGLYDEILEGGVRRFQARHGLDADGVVGKATLAALNVTAEQRVNEIRLNLERGRWVQDDIVDDFIAVNIAGFRAYVLKDGEIVWQTEVQVGRTYHQSPVFRDEMQYVVLNPTWTVPRSIATKEMLPKIKNDPDYFKKRDFDVKDRNGKLVDPETIDWSQVTRNNFGYTFVQRPGPRNALGRIKFIFPNEHSVYLHDTPSKALFDRAERTFSHGCIRVKNPLELAEVLLGPDGWDRQKLQATLDSRETKTVFLSQRLPVFLLYWTAAVNEEGVVHFYGDPYDRDARIAEALDASFEMEIPGS